VQAQQSPTSSQKILRYCIEGGPETFAPSLSGSSTTQDALSPIYGRLIRFYRGTTRLTPSLAEHWLVSKDGKEYTFYLRKGVKWHSNDRFQPSRDFNADDVIFMIERQWKPDHPFHALNQFKHNYFQSAGFGRLIKEVVRVNDHTVKFVLNEANTSFLYFFTMGFSGIQSQEYASAMLKQGTPEFIDQHPIGTGPFTLVVHEKNQRILYRTFDDYWQYRSKLGGLELIITPSAAERWEKIKSQACDVMTAPRTEDLLAMRSNPNVVVQEMPGINVAFWSFNLNKAPFDDVRVRKALNLAINKKALVEQVYQGSAVPAVSPIPPTMWSHNAQLKDDGYDPEAAKRLLSEAGLGQGFSTDLWAMPVTRNYNPNPQLMAQLIQADLARVGVQAEIKSVPWSEYGRRMSEGEHQTGLLGWTSSSADPDYFFYNLLACDAAKSGGANVSKFCDAGYDNLIKAARITANPALRIPMYEKAQVIFKQQMPWIPLAHSVQFLIHRKEVKNLRMSPFSGRDFSGVEMN
jgi:dipeptide transport system substrate-binding protein